MFGGRQRYSAPHAPYAGEGGAEESPGSRLECSGNMLEQNKCLLIDILSHLKPHFECVEKMFRN